MDFELAFATGCVVSIVITIITIGLFANALRRTYARLSSDTRTALLLYGGAYLLISLSISISHLFSQVILLHATLPVFLALLSSAQLFIIESDPLRRRRSISIFHILTLVCLLALLISFGPSPFFIGLVEVQSLITIYYAIRLALTTPSAFSISSIVLLAILLLPYITGFYAVLPSYVHYYPLVLAVVAVSCGILSSMLRPWRYMITLSVAFLTVIVSSSLVYSSIMATQYVITSYAIVAGLASITLLVPLGYFVEQAAATRARTPLFVAITLVSVSLLTVTHSVNFSYSYLSGSWFEILSFKSASWDFGILFFDWVVGIVAVSAFLLASIATTFSERRIEIVVDALLFIDSILVVLGHPYVRADVMGNERWQLLPLYIPMLILIFAAVFMYLKFTLKMRKMGTTAAALRFVGFTLAMLSIGIVAMFSDQMPYIIVVLLMVAACGILLRSNPAATTRKRDDKARARRRASSGEVS